MNGFIKIDRKITEWEWYTDIKTLKLFFHLLLSANYRDVSFCGALIKRGQLAKSIDTLSKETGLTPDEIRTAVKHLLKTGDITCWRHPKYTLFTVVNYDSFQEDTERFPNNSQSLPERFPNTSQSLPEHFPITSRQYKNNKNNKNNNKNNNARDTHNSSFDPDEFFRIAVESSKRRPEERDG